MKRWVKVVGGLALAVVLLGGLSAFGRMRWSQVDEGGNAFEAGEPGERGTVEFRVRVPEWTQPEDAIVLHMEGTEFVMARQPDGAYAAHVSFRGYARGEPHAYGYSRGGFVPIGGEMGHIEGDLPRVFRVGPSLVEDEVEAWKLHAAPVAPLDVGSWAANATPAPRAAWRGGVMMADFWNDDWALQVPSTIARLRSEGHEWVAFAPPWDYASTDPPVISNQGVAVPAAPDEALRAHVRAFKDAGFKVLLQPQVCCTDPGYAGRDEAWWRAFYDQHEAFVRRHAALCKDVGADLFLIGGNDRNLPGSPGAPAFAHDAWQRILDAAEECGVPVGVGTVAFPSTTNVQEPWPASDIDFFDRVDFVSVGLWSGLTDNATATQEELDALYEREMLGIDMLAARTGKPIVFGQVAYFSENASWRPKGAETYYTWGHPEDNPSVLDHASQARVMEAIFRAAARRPHVEGAFAFGYWYVDAPDATDSSIRAKPAEDVWTAWGRALAATSG